MKVRLLEMGTKTTTVKKLYKVTNPELSDKLIKLGFSYILDGDIIAFIQTDELDFVLQHEFSETDFISDNKLRF